MRFFRSRNMQMGLFYFRVFSEKAMLRKLPNKKGLHRKYTYENRSNQVKKIPWIPKKISQHLTTSKLKLYFGMITTLSVGAYTLSSDAWGKGWWSYKDEYDKKKREKAPRFDSISSGCENTLGDYFIKRSSVSLIKHSFNSQTESNSVAISAIIGTPGSGKSELAKQYARNLENKINSWNKNTKKTYFIYFIRAEDIDCLVEEIHSIGSYLKIRGIDDPLDIMQATYDYISEDYDEWLLIFDNVTTYEVIKDFMPQKKEAYKNGKIILTSRDIYEKSSDATPIPDIANNINIKKINITFDLKEKEAVLLCNKILGSTSKNKSLDKAQKTILVQHLGFLLLPIYKACLHIRESKGNKDNFSNYPIEEFTAKYVQLFERIHKKKLPEIPNQDEINHVIELLTLNEMKNKYAEKIMYLFSFINEEISTSTVKAYIKKEIERETGKNNKRADTLCESALITLEKYGLLKRDKKSGQIQIHRKTQESIILILKDKGEKTRYGWLGDYGANHLIKKYKQEISKFLSEYGLQTYDNYKVSKKNSYLPVIRELRLHVFYIKANIKDVTKTEIDKKTLISVNHFLGETHVLSHTGKLRKAQAAQAVKEAKEETPKYKAASI